MNLKNYLNIFQQYNVFTIIKRVLIRIYFKIRGLFFFRKYYKRYMIFKNVVFLIYSMGRTGSSSVYYTFLKEFPFNKIFHVHILSDFFLEGRNDRNIVLANKVKQYLKRNPDKKVTRISLYRDPVSRVLSDHFQIKNNRDYGDVSIKSIISVIKKRPIKDLAYFWFDKDFLPFTNHSLENVRMKESSKYHIFANSKFSSLLIRTDHLSRFFNDAIFEFLGISDLELYNFNERTGKGLNEIYNQLKESYTESTQNLEERYSTDIFRLFYSEDERKQLIKKWKIK